MLYWLVCTERIVLQNTKLNTTTDIHGGAQQDRIVGGSQQVSEKLAQHGLPAASILYNKPVRRIAQERSHVRVYTDHDVYTARFVVVALPPALAGRIISLAVIFGMDICCWHIYITCNNQKNKVEV
jgi:monoamine oxidase